MTKEEKQLLLRDLSARLPYGVICTDSRHGDSRLTDIDTVDETVYCDDFDEYVELGKIKPYLRSMSSMTDKERTELKKLCEEDLSEFAGFIRNGHRLSHDGLYMFDKLRQLEFCLSHHFDYRGLIEKGLAIEAPEGMYN